MKLLKWYYKAMRDSVRLPDGISFYRYYDQKLRDLEKGVRL